LRAFGLVLALLLVGLMLAPRAVAFEGRSGEQVVIRAGEVIDDDLYVAATSVTVDGTIRGDLVMAGQVLILNGTVEGNLMAAGQSVIINGTVGGSTRVAAQGILVDSKAQVARDLVFFGYSLETRPGSAITRDLIAGGYQALLAGAIGRDLKGAVQALELRGPIGGDVTVEVGAPREGGPIMVQAPPNLSIPTVATGLTVADTAEIGGQLSYTARQELPIGGRAAGGVHFTPLPLPAPETPAATLAAGVRDSVGRFLALTLIGLLLVWVAPGWTRRLADTVQERPLPSLGWGFVSLVAFIGAAIALPVATILLAIGFGIITLGSLAGPLVAVGFVGEAALIVAFIVLASFIVQAAMAFLGGRWLLTRGWPERAGGRVIPLLVGLVLYVLVTAIPVLGGLIAFGVTLLGLGAVWIWTMSHWGGAPATPPVVPTIAPAPAM
jgi:cytoskeletal protein CcmA (bactofilin family)